MNGPYQKIFLQLRTHLLLNLSHCKTKMCDYKAAISSATDVLVQDPACCQAYCARAKAHQAAGDLDKACEDLTEAVKLSPTDRELCSHLIKIKEELRTTGSLQHRDNKEEEAGTLFSDSLGIGLGQGERIR